MLVASDYLHELETNFLGEAAERLAAISETDLGHNLSERSRYGMFKPPSMTTEEWASLLDADVNNFEHNGLTAILAYSIAITDDLTPEMAKAMIMVGSIHDLPEDVTGGKSGDRQFNLVTVQDEEKERARLNQLAMDPKYPISAGDARQALSIMSDSKAKPPTTYEGWYFNIIERVGYLRTAFIAWDAAWNNKSLEAGVQDNLLWMIGNIFANHLAYLQDVRKQSKSVELLLSGQEDTINDIVETLQIPTVQTNIRKLCGVTEVDGDRLDPETEIDRINRACEAWQLAA